MGKHIPMRMCVACRTMHPQNEMLRFVKDTEDNTVKPDFDKTHFGRGAYICNNDECIAAAKKKNGLEKHFKCEVPRKIYEVMKGR